MKRIAIFCGSSSGRDPIFRETAKMVGTYFASQGIEIVFGGGQVGLMGAIADAALEAGGRVTGVIPDFLHTKELVHRQVTTLINADSMHDRKQIMYDLSDAFLILPGGFGTLDELFEITTWSQLGRHGKPIGILNIKHYFSPLLSIIQNMVEEGFLNEANAGIVLHDVTLDALLTKMASYQPGVSKKWIPDEKK